MTELELLVKEWREAQDAIDDLTASERARDTRPLNRLIAAHDALREYADEHLQGEVNDFRGH
jgi:hypothetical protein